MGETGTFDAAAYKPLIERLTGWIDQLHDTGAISDLEHDQLTRLAEDMRRQYVNYIQWFGFEKMEVQRLGNEIKYWDRKATAKFTKLYAEIKQLKAERSG